ncbi:hypothetical protein V495_04301 [Pseudogymnoascus sp. VKM F-4514 (FW-929)]|nr:hypothetical protein V495_04301 [Pseudogymnoascus sp. VKM F-4514 (FW-929)]KFY55975.1 hypothetical protein V497_06589 [Pseudogymnoascus sp. VKM F-4516 (FW-969)]
MANRRLEILVHTTAPSLGREDALYRSLAAAYLDFKPQGRIALHGEDGVASEHDELAGYGSPGRQLRDDILHSQSNEDQSHMFSNDGDSCLPVSQLSSAPRTEYLTRSKTTTAPSSAIQFLDISFMSVDGMNSPRLRTRDRGISSHPGQTGLRESVQQEEQASRPIIGGRVNQSQRRETGGTSTSQLESSPSIPTCSTPSVIRDTFLSQFESPDYSSPSPVRAPLSPPPAALLDSEVGNGERQSGPTLRSRPHLSEQRQPIFNEPKEITSPLSPAPTRGEEAPSATLTSALRAGEYSSSSLPRPLPLGQYSLQVRRTPPPDSPHRSPKKRNFISLPSPTPARKYTRLPSDLSHVSDTPPVPLGHAIRQTYQDPPIATKPVLPPSSVVPSQNKLLRKRRASRLPRSLTIYPLPAPTSTEVTTTFLTVQLANLASEIGYARFRPVLQTREIRKQERGYWGIDIPDGEGGWDDRTVEKTWEFLHEYIGRGKAGWGVWCVRDGGNAGEGREGGRQIQKMGKQWRIYCWGEIVSEVYLLLYLASSRRIRSAGACWFDGGGDCVVTMPSDGKSGLEGVTK